MNSKGLRRESMWYSSEVKEKTSALWLYGCERATSGAMYRSEPVMPVSCRAASSSAASFSHSASSPKSASTTRPSAKTPTLFGLMSRWKSLQGGGQVAA